MNLNYNPWKIKFSSSSSSSSSLSLSPSLPLSLSPRPLLSLSLINVCKKSSNRLSEVGAVAFFFSFLFLRNLLLIA